MKFDEIKSYAKINISLNVLKKQKNKLHKIESLITFINLYDTIYIKKIKKKNNIVKFYGKFSKTIKRKNTITDLFKILDEKKLLKQNKYLVKIKKKIPQKSGMGGGSMNAASILNYFTNKKIIKLKFKEIRNITRLVGSDVEIGVDTGSTVFKSNLYLIKNIKNIKLHLLIVKPNFGCSTKEIYSSIRQYSKPILKYIINKKIKFSDLINLKNDLEKVAIKKYPSLKNLKKNLETLPNVKLVRMTGSGSSFIAYFLSKSDAMKAYKIFRKKSKNYWSIISKTI